MPVSISVTDLKAQISINHAYAKLASGPLSVAAERLATLWLAQLPETAKREVELAGSL